MDADRTWVTALEFMGWEIPKNWEDAGSYFEREDGSIGFIKAIPRKTWKDGRWTVLSKDDYGHRFFWEEPMTRCPFTWREIQELSDIRIVCDLDPEESVTDYDDRLCYHILGRAASEEEIHDMEARASQLHAFYEDYKENDQWEWIEYRWNECVIDGDYSVFRNDHEAADWWYGLNGILDEWRSVYTRRSIRSHIYEWCHLLAACPGLDIVIAATEWCSYRQTESSKEQMEKWLCKKASFVFYIGQNKVEIKSPGDAGRLYRQYRKKYQSKNSTEFRLQW